MSSCASRPIPAAIRASFPQQLEEMLQLCDHTQRQIEREQLTGKELYRSEDSIPGTTIRREYVSDRELLRGYHFSKGKVFFINQSNGDGQFDAAPGSFERLYKLLGAEDLNLSSRAGQGVREYIYLDFGIVVVGSISEKQLVSVGVFKPMTAEEYKRWIWVDPSEFEKMLQL